MENLPLLNSPKELLNAEKKFHALKSQWLDATRYLSDTDLAAMHGSYQKIIGMGRDVLPFLLAELEKDPSPWFWALRAITCEDPVPSEHQGRVKLMAQDWLKWAQDHGYR